MLHPALLPVRRWRAARRRRRRRHAGSVEHVEPIIDFRCNCILLSRLLPDATDGGLRGGGVAEASTGSVEQQATPMPFAVDHKPKAPRKYGGISDNTSVVSWYRSVDPMRAADAALAATQRTRLAARNGGRQLADEGMLPPTAVQGSSAVTRTAEVPSDRSLHLRTMMQRQPPRSPTTVLVESAEFAIAAVLSGPFALTGPLTLTGPLDANASVRSGQFRQVELSVGETPELQPEPEQQPKSTPKKRRSPAKRATAGGGFGSRRTAPAAGSAHRGARATKPSANAAAGKRFVASPLSAAAVADQPATAASPVPWPQQHSGVASKVYGIGPAPLAASPTFSALPAASEQPAQADVAVAGTRACPKMHATRTDRGSKTHTRSGGHTRDDDAWGSPTTSWISPTLHQAVSPTSEDTDGHTARGSGGGHSSPSSPLVSPPQFFDGRCAYSQFPPQPDPQRGP